MSLENHLFSSLSTISEIARVGGFYAVSPLIFPQPPRYNPEWPAIRYTFVSSVPIEDLCGDGDDDTSDVRVQIDVVDTTYAAMRALRLKVMAVMSAFIPPAILQASSDEVDIETHTYRAILDYLIHPSTGSGSP